MSDEIDPQSVAGALLITLQRSVMPGTMMKLLAERHKPNQLPRANQCRELLSRLDKMENDQQFRFFLLEEASAAEADCVYFAFHTYGILLTKHLEPGTDKFASEADNLMQDPLAVYICRTALDWMIQAAIQRATPKRLRR